MVGKNEKLTSFVAVMSENVPGFVRDIMMKAQIICFLNDYFS